MNKVMAGVAAVVVTLALAGCAPATNRSSNTDEGTTTQSNPSGFSENKITLADGRIISCITWSTWDYFHDAMSSGVSCDWEKPTSEE